jgi:hypothetical protein
VVDREAVVDLLGAIAYGELTAFERMALDSRMAPTLDDKVKLAGMACAELGHHRLLGDYLGSEVGVDPAVAMAPFIAPVDEFHESTRPSDWLEGLVKAYVGDNIAADFYREISVYLDPRTRELVLEVLEDTGHAAFVVERVTAAIGADSRVAGRLALWGRRLVGEALTQAQRVAAERDALLRLVAGSGDLGEFSKMLGRLTEGHTARMASLGLSA